MGIGSLVVALPFNTLIIGEGQRNVLKVRIFRSSRKIGLDC